MPYNDVSPRAHAANNEAPVRTPRPRTAIHRGPVRSPRPRVTYSAAPAPTRRPAPRTPSMELSERIAKLDAELGRARVVRDAAKHAPVPALNGTWEVAGTIIACVAAFAGGCILWTYLGL